MTTAAEERRRLAERVDQVEHALAEVSAKLDRLEQTLAEVLAERLVPIERRMLEDSAPSSGVGVMRWVR